MKCYKPYKHYFWNYFYLVNINDSNDIVIRRIHNVKILSNNGFIYLGAKHKNLNIEKVLGWL
jgi:CMP-N-acetylneuraminic acid synthetase